MKGKEQTEDKNTESVPVSGTAVAADENDDIYVVEKGDTLAIISKKMYGDVSSCRCDQPDEWIAEWELDLYWTKIDIAINPCYTVKDK